MANYNSLKATIDAQIKANGVQAITGPILNAVLTAMINTIGNGYTLQGSVAQTTDNPGAPDNPVAYLAAGPGTYTNFGGTVIPDDGHAYLLTWDTSWHAVQLPLPTFDLANGKQDALTFDATPTPGSPNPVTSDGIYQAIDSAAALKQDKDTGDTAGHVAVMDGNGNSVDGGEALADLATKEDVEAVEQEVAQIAGEAGLAEAVIDTDGAGTEQEFTFRKSGGDGGAYYRKIKGKTIAWNQLAATSAVYDEGMDAGITLTVNADGSVTINGTASANTSFRFLQATTVGHKTYYSIETANSGLQVSDGYTSSGWGTPSFVKNAENTSLYVYIKGGETFNNVKIWAKAIDLTLAGIADEISTAAEFEALYPGYYPYNPGTLISNDAEAVETTGVNQWDEEWENGYWDYQGKHDSGSYIRTKNYIPVIAGESYYFHSIGPNFEVDFWDANGNFISPRVYQTRSFTAPSNAKYATFYIEQSSYQSGICFNLSNPAIDGQYFPYWKRTLQLGITTKEDTDGNVPFADGMKGVGTAADWADKVGGEKRMGRINLGDLEWSYNGSVFVARMSSIPGISTSLLRTLICSKYAFSDELSSASVPDKAIANNNWFEAADVLIKDSAYTDAATFKAAMNGVMLDYPLATPVPFTWAEPLNLGVKVDENGTERAVAPEGATAPIAPFVADTTYTMSIARMVAKLQSI